MEFEKIKKIIIENAKQNKMTTFPYNFVISKYPCNPLPTPPDIMKIKYDLSKEEYHISWIKSNLDKTLNEEYFYNEFNQILSRIKEEEIGRNHKWMRIE